MKKKTKRLGLMMVLNGGELDGLKIGTNDQDFLPCGISFLLPNPEPLQQKLNLDIDEPDEMHEVFYWLGDRYDQRLDTGIVDRADYYLDEGDEK